MEQQRPQQLLVGAGGLISHVAPALARKGVGAITVRDDDEVEASNLNRQFFLAEDVGYNKADALVARLAAVCTAPATLTAVPLRLEDALRAGVPLRADVAVVGVDNNPARVLASRHFRAIGVTAVFCAVSADADHGFALVQEAGGPCPACLHPDAADDARHPCPGTPAALDILQAVGAIATYAVDSCLMARPRSWNYRRLSMAYPAADGATFLRRREGCRLCGD
ncbi:ThiF family adenylyltransferase [Luteitalea sp.]|uniref:HesA/MoeB/ThiF family protein n=1 Tax=Luteitalea sp. TaxID=2004800 RepID=UPI0025C1CABC|nr:ThiF family adenylyltransferase [Luteitalea sp.]